MSDEEHYSLCWNNFNANLSAGFHDSLCRGELVDVTLVAEGHMVKAHRLVLSVCSPVFREMFAAMPTNQHAFVVLKDVTHAALQDLVTFIYCGEVNVKNEALSTFINTAESLQIKGLTDNESPKVITEEVIGSQIMTMSSPPPPTVLPPVTGNVRRVAQRATGRVKIEKGESEDSSAEDHRAPKRVAVAAVSTPKAAPKRIKVASTSKLATIKHEEVLIELPPAMPAPEPAQHETVEQTESLIEEEEDSYADMKYDETYFTENEEKHVASFAEQSSTADVSAVSDNQDFITSSAQTFIVSRKHVNHLVLGEFVYRSNLLRQGKHSDMLYWECVRNRDSRCKGRLKSVGNSLFMTNNTHNHPPDNARINKAKMNNQVIKMYLEDVQKKGAPGQN